VNTNWERLGVVQFSAEKHQRLFQVAIVLKNRDFKIAEPSWQVGLRNQRQANLIIGTVATFL